MGDKGFDDGKLIKKTWDEYGIKPIIDIRNMWKDEDPTRLLNGTTNIVYNHCGTVSCHCEKTELQNPGEDLYRTIIKQPYIWQGGWVGAEN